MLEDSTAHLCGESHTVSNALSMIAIFKRRATSGLQVHATGKSTVICCREFRAILHVIVMCTMILLQSRFATQ